MLSEMEKLFLALADKTRLRLINLMRGGQISVGDFAELLSESQPKISRHLAYLKNAGIALPRRRGKLVYYHLQTPEDFFAAEILKSTLKWLDSQTKMREEYEKLRSFSGAGSGETAATPLQSSEVSAEANIMNEKKKELEIFLL